MSQPGFAGVQYLLDINGSAGAWVNVPAKGVVRRLVIEESQVTSAGAANVPQGIIDYRIPNDGTANGFTTVFAATQGMTLPIKLGSEVADRGPWGEIIGQPGQQIIGQPAAQASTVMIQLRSGTATGTTVIVREYT